MADPPPARRNAKVSVPGTPTRAGRPDFGQGGGAQAEWPHHRKESAAAPSAAAGMNWTVVVALCIVLAWLTGLIMWFTGGSPAAAHTKLFDGKE